MDLELMEPDTSEKIGPMPVLEGYDPDTQTLPELESPLYLPPELPQKRKSHRIRPELIMGLIALLALLLLIWMIILCRPYFGTREEDPQLLLEKNHLTQESLAVEHLTQPPETIPETEETIKPTIPPESNPYGRLDFQYREHNYLYCLRTDSYAGVDVSAYQGDINWKKVKESGIDFALIRLGYRGYGKAGRLVEDEWAQKNLYESKKEGLDVGAYFFSQALTFEEVDEEIDFMLKILGDFTLEMPLVLDWEIPSPDARTANVDAQTLTELQLYFCQRVEALGYTPMVYFNWHQSENLYYLSELEAYPFWLALYQDRMTFPWKVEMWQFTCTGTVPGINGDVDVNVYMPG